MNIALECCWGVCEAERQDRVFKVPVSFSKRCLPFSLSGSRKLTYRPSLTSTNLKVRLMLRPINTTNPIRYEC
jgi:hypothetical protein